MTLWKIVDGVLVRGEYDHGVSHNEQDLTDLTETLQRNGILPKVTSDPQKIVISGNVFKAVKAINLTKEATVCKRRVENQTEISDHIIESPAVFDFELELINVDSEFEILDKLFATKKPFDLTTHRGQYNNMVLSKLSDRKGLQSNTTTASITVQQILIGSSQTKPQIDETKVDPNIVAPTGNSSPGDQTVRELVFKKPFISIPGKQPDQSARAYVETLPPAITQQRVNYLAGRR